MIWLVLTGNVRESLILGKYLENEYTERRKRERKSQSELFSKSVGYKKITHHYIHLGKIWGER